MNDYHEIQALLNKYWEGETSIDEERRLKRYFAGEAIDERFAGVAPLFRAIREEQAVQYQKDSTTALRPQMHQWQRYWPVAASVALLLAVGLWRLSQKTTEPSVAGLEPSRLETPIPEPAAAPVALEPRVVEQSTPENSMPVHLAKKHKRIKPAKPSSLDPEEAAAIAEIKAALALVSSKLKRGRQEVIKGANHLEEMDRIFKKKAG